MKVYIALWYSYYKDLADNAIDGTYSADWRKQIENWKYSNDARIEKSSRDAVFKFLFVHGFSSRQVSISDATGIDKDGIETFRKHMDAETTWLKEFNKSYK